MKKSIITLLIIAMLACIGLVSCKNEVQTPAEELVSVSFDNDSGRALSASLEGFAPETYYWKYAAKKADGSNLISGQTATYNEAGALWIKEGKPGFSDTQGKYKVQGFSQGLWNFTLYGYKWTDADLDGQIDPEELQLVYSGETTGHLLKAGTNDTHSVSVVVSPAQGGNGTLWVKITGEDAIYLDRAMPIEAAANVKVKLTVKAIDAAEPIIDEFVTADYKPSLAAGSYMVTVQFTNDDGGVVFASGSVVATVYSGLTTTVKGNLTEVVTYADFGAEQNPDIITEKIGTTTAINEGSTETAPISLSGTSTKVTASLSNDTAQSLITKLKTDLAADSTSSSMQLNLSVDTTEATETTITYEIGMEAVLTYRKNSVETTTTSTVDEVADFVTVVIDMQAGLTDVSVTHSGNDMTSGEQWAEKTGRTTLELSDFLANAGTEANPDPDGYYYYYQYSENVNNTVVNKAQLYIKTKTFSPFKLSYTVPEAVAAIGSKTYTTLQDAISEAVNGDTVILLKNVSVGTRIVVDKTITLDLNGNTITGTENKKDAPVFEIGKESAGDLTIIGTTAGSTINAKATAVFVNANSKFAVNGGSYSNSYYDSATPAGSYLFDIQGTATIDSVTLTGVVKGIRAEGTGSNVTVLNSSADVAPGAATGDYVGKGWGLFGSDMGRLTIESGTYKTTYAAARQMIDIKNDGIVTINGGSFTTCLKEGTELDPIPALVVFNGGQTSSDNGNKLTINGGIFTYGGKLGRVNALNNHAVVTITGGTFNDFVIDGDVTSYHLEYSISGGSFSTNPTVYVAPGCEANYDSATNRWIVYPAVTVVHGSLETGYGTFAAALNAAQNGDTLVINKNISLTSSNSLSKSITLDLNGNTIASTKPFFTVGSNVNLTIKDSGDNGKINVSLGSDWNNDCLIDSRSSGSKVIIEGGSLAVERTAGSSKSTYGVRLSSGSSFEMKGGTIRVTGLGGGAYSWTASNNYYGVSNSGSGSVIISDGEIVCESAGSNYALSSSAGTVLISGGRIESTNKNNSAKGPYAMYITGGTAEITGGTIVVDDRDTSGWSDAHLAYGVTEISGGTFISPKSLDINDVRNRLAEGCELKDEGNNTWKVVIKTMGPGSGEGIEETDEDF